MSAKAYKIDHGSSDGGIIWKASSDQLNPSPNFQNEDVNYVGRIDDHCSGMINYLSLVTLLQIWPKMLCIC